MSKADDPTRVEGRALPDVTSPEHGGPMDALSVLLRFHGRIRSALDDLDTLAGHEPLGTVDQEDAKALAEFFRGPIIWHDIDEETSVLPRLKRLLPESHPSLEELKQVTRDHERMERLLSKIGPVLEAACQDPAPEAIGLKQLADELREHLTRHLHLEEQHVFPLARKLLDAKTVREIEAEIQARMPDREAGRKRAIALD